MQLQTKGNGAYQLYIYFFSTAASELGILTDSSYSSD